MTQAQAASKIKALIQKRIKDLGLIKSGSLYNSIKVIFIDGSFAIEANDYYSYLDETHNITDWVTDSSEFDEIIAELMATKIDEELDKALE